MGRPAIAFLAVLAAVGGWLLLTDASLPHIPANADSVVEPYRRWFAQLQPTVSASPQVLRIATWDLDGFGHKDFENATLVQILTKIMSQFDVVALQNIVSSEPYLIPGLADLVGQGQVRYDYVASEPSGRHGVRQQFALIYRADRVDLDRTSVYRVQDPDDLIAHEPLVASFRCLQEAPDRAFTFTLVNVLVDDDPQEAEREQRLLWKILESVRGDGRGEDDIILLGNFRRSAQALSPWIANADALWAVTERTTNVDKDSQTINILCTRRATVEWTGRTGVLDLVREYNLSVDEARAVSPYLPVWCEFLTREGALPSAIPLAR